MADQRFFQVVGTFTAGELAELTGSELADAAQADTVLRDVAPLDLAGPDDISFLENRKYVSAFEGTKAGACIVKAEFLDKAPDGTLCLISKNPYMAYAQVAAAFYPDAEPDEFRAPTAFIDETAEIGAECRIMHGAYIGPKVKIGARCRVMPNAVIMDAVEIGEDCVIGPNSTLSHCLLGDRVRIYPGAQIGQRGFGFAIDETGFKTVPQLGRVVIGNDVEVGANTTIDRGAGPDTEIGDGTRIDNLVQLGHNVKVGRNCVLVSQTGISGSTKLGDFVMTGGQSGLTGHIEIGSGAKIGAQSGVMRDVPAGEEYIGSPAIPARQFMRQVATLSRMSGSGKKKKTGTDE